MILRNPGVVFVQWIGATLKILNKYNFYMSVNCHKLIEAFYVIIHGLGVAFQRF